MSEIKHKTGMKRKVVGLTSDSDSLFVNATPCVNSRPIRKRKRRHIPHSQRSMEFVEKRNGRERKRVDDLNGAFESLKDRVPYIPRRNVRTSKMKILTNAISYIQHLTTLLGQQESPSDSYSSASVLDSTDLSGPSNTSSPSPSSLVSLSEIELLEDRIPPILGDNLPDSMINLPNNRNSLPDSMSSLPDSAECLQGQTSGYPRRLDLSPDTKDYLPCTLEGSQDGTCSLSKGGKFVFSNVSVNTDMDINPARRYEFYCNNSSSALQTINRNKISSIYPRDPGMERYGCDPLLATLSLMGHDLTDGDELRLVTTLPQLPTPLRRDNIRIL